MPRKVRDENEIRATADELPTEPPKELVERIKAKQKSAKLVYRAGWWRNPLTEQKEKTALVKCTACGEEFHLEHIGFSSGCSRGYGMRSDPFGFLDPADKQVKATGDTCLCPCCGAGAEALHIGKITQTAVIEKTCFMTLHNIRGHLVLLSWILFKECNKYAEVFYNVRLYEGLATVGGFPVRFTGYEKCMYYGISWHSKWILRPKFKDNIDRWSRDDIIGFSKKTLEATDGANSALDVFIREGGSDLRIGAYLQIWTKYPQIENLVRSGFSKFVSKIIDAATFNGGYYYQKETFSISEIPKYINVKAKKPAEILGLEKEEFHLVNKYSLEVLSFYSYIKRNRKIKLTEEQLKLAEEIGIKQLRDLFEKPIREGFVPPVVRTLNYLQKHEKPRDQFEARVTPNYLYDYWNMLSQVQNGLPPELLFPRDIRAAHDNVALRVKEKTDENINAGIAAFAASLDWLSFSDEETGLFIRVCRTQEELIKEGKFLSHCVGTYAKRFSLRETCILFIRRATAPEIPFYTLEYRDGKVIQNRGRNNRDRTEEVEIFESKWLEYIQNYKEFIKENGKRSSRNQERIRAGA